jgi:hypothetical protein
MLLLFTIELAHSVKVRNKPAHFGSLPAAVKPVSFRRKEGSRFEAGLESMAELHFRAAEGAVTKCMAAWPLNGTMGYLAA